MGKKIDVFQNGSLVDSFEELTDAREKVEEILAEGLKKEKKLSEIPFISLQEFDDEEDIEMYLHTDTYGELEEDLIEFLNDKGITDSDALKGMKEWLGVEVRLDMGSESKKEIFQKDISFLKGNEDLIGSFLKTNRPDLFEEILMDALKEYDLPIESINLEDKRIYVYPLLDDNGLEELLETFYENQTLEEIGNKVDIVKVVGESLGSDKLVVKIDVSKEEILEKTPSIEYLVGRIEKGGYAESHSLKENLIDNYQDKIEDMGEYVLSDDFPNFVTLFSEGIEWDISYVKLKNIQLIATEALEYMEDRELTTTEFLNDYFMDMLMENYDKYLIVNIDVYTDPQDWKDWMEENK
jgi:hypothetical protein